MEEKVGEERRKGKGGKRRTHPRSDSGRTMGRDAIRRDRRV
jgi:hypothetical protein